MTSLMTLTPANAEFVITLKFCHKTYLEMR